MRALFKAYYDEPSYKHVRPEERLAAIDRVLQRDAAIEEAWAGGDEKSRLHVALYMLACIEDHRGGYAANICCFPRQKVSPAKNNNNRYRWSASFEIYRVVVRDSQTYLDIRLALPLSGVLMLTDLVGKDAEFGLSWEWDHCAYMEKCYEPVANEKKGAKRQKIQGEALEDSAWERFWTPPSDPSLPLLGRNFVLERRLIVTTPIRKCKMLERLTQSIGNSESISWLNVFPSPSYPYLEAMRLSSLAQEESEGGVDLIFRMYELMFYVCLENCSKNLPRIGTVISRDSVSQRPLTFEVTDSENFVLSILQIFAPPKPGEALQYRTMDRTCIAPIVLTDNRDEIKALVSEGGGGDVLLRKLAASGCDVEGYSLPEMLSFQLFPDSEAVIKRNKKGEAVRRGLNKFSLMHLSLYSPNYEPH